MKNRRFLDRLAFAFAGLARCWRGERSFRFQALVAVAAIVVLVVLRPALLWTALILLLVALVLSAELFNSALESLADRLQSEPDERIRAAKDMAAAAVLVLAATAAAVGVLAAVAIWQGAP